MSVSGRKRGKEWSEVIVDGDSISCCHCHELLSKKIERIRNHLSKCHQYKKSQESKNNHQNSLEVEVDEEFMPSPSSSYRVADEPVSQLQENSAEAWLTQYDASLMEPLMRFQIKDEESFPTHLFQEPTS